MQINKMPNSLSLLSLALCSLTLAQRPPVPRPDPSSNTIIAFPRESDIVFPETSESSESRQIQRLFKLMDFTFNSRDNVPSPKPPPRHRMPPNMPGQPFPPPPTGRRQKKRKNRRRICEHSEWTRRVYICWKISCTDSLYAPKEYSEYIERIFPNDTAVAEDANDDEFDGRVLARPGQYPHMVHTSKADKNPSYLCLLIISKNKK